jgi:D-alanyl-D-alanine dipeptidase
MKDDFVFVDEFVPEIGWDAKYATWDNFTGKPVDGYLANRIAGTRAGAALLVDNADLDPAWIETTLIPVLTDPERIAAMSAHASAAGAPDADVVLARHVLTAVAERRRFAS